MTKLKNTLAVIISMCMVFALCAMPAAALDEQNTEDIVILYENDVHCSIEGYSKLAAMKKELLKTYAHVGVVSSGDYIQGGSIGAVSQGEYIVQLMNLVGYDAVTLGNHEFDYHLTRLHQLVSMMNTKPICCNFSRIGESETVFEPYTIVEYGSTSVAYIGITTPDTVTSSSPAQFKDESGKFIYTFHAEDLSDVVQESIDAAYDDGADYVIALSHIGDQELTYDIEELIAGTSGLDAVLDAHSHSVIEQRIVNDKNGDKVVLTSTGTKFEHIGRLTISDGEIVTELIKTEDYQNTDPETDAYIQQIEEEYSKLGDRIIGVSEVDLLVYDADGRRMVRTEETNLGDFCADAFRCVTGADIGYINGGGLRAEIKAGDVTFNDLLNLFPFNNQAVTAEISGSTIKDMIEMALINYPAEDGSFPHMSGIEFSVNTAIPSSVELNDQEEFAGVSGQYRVYNIMVLNGETGEYEPLELDKKYIFASHNYYILEYGSGMTMFKDAKIIANDGVLDVELVEKYITEHLDGVIGQQYREVTPNITFTDGEISSPSAPDGAAVVIAVVCAVGVLFAAAAVVYFVRKAKSKSDIE